MIMMKRMIVMKIMIMMKRMHNNDNDEKNDNHEKNDIDEKNDNDEKYDNDEKNEKDDNNDNDDNFEKDDNDDNDIPEPEDYGKNSAALHINPLWCQPQLDLQWKQARTILKFISTQKFQLCHLSVIKLIYNLSKNCITQSQHNAVKSVV